MFSHFRPLYITLSLHSHSTTAWQPRVCRCFPDKHKIYPRFPVNKQLQVQPYPQTYPLSYSLLQKPHKGKSPLTLPSTLGNLLFSLQINNLLLQGVPSNRPLYIYSYQYFQSIRLQAVKSHTQIQTIILHKASYGYETNIQCDGGNFL